MSEQRLRDLGRDAELLVDLPDLGGLERRGRALRLRRQVGVVAAAAVVATAGAFLFQDRTHAGARSRPRRARSSPPRTRVARWRISSRAPTRSRLPGRRRADRPASPCRRAGTRGRPEPFRLPARADPRGVLGTQHLVGRPARAQGRRRVATQECQQTRTPTDVRDTGSTRRWRRSGGCPAAVVVGDPAGRHPLRLPGDPRRATIDDAGRCEGLTALFGSRTSRAGSVCGAHGHGHLGRRRRGDHAGRGRRHPRCRADAGRGRAGRHRRVRRFVLPRLIGQTRRTERSTPIFSIRCSGLWNSSDQ